MTGSVWRWQILGRHHEIRDTGTIQSWGDRDEQCRLADRWATDRMALLLWDAEPRWEKLTGWRVRVWSVEHGYETVADAEEWLRPLREGALARMRDRLELLPRTPVRR